VTKNGDRFVRLKRNGRTTLFPLTECGTRFTQESRKWSIQFRDSAGRWRRVAGYADKESTTQLTAALERKAERLQSGLGDPYENGKAQPLKNHVEAFRRYLEGKANSAKHVNHTCRRVEQSLLGCHFNYWADISSSQLLGWLADQRASQKFGAKTSNHYLAALKEFCQWMVKDGRVPSSPLIHLHFLQKRTCVGSAAR
jgi:hypothetical protein